MQKRSVLLGIKNQIYCRDVIYVFYLLLSLNTLRLFCTLNLDHMIKSVRISAGVRMKYSCNLSGSGVVVCSTLVNTNQNGAFSHSAVLSDYQYTLLTPQERETKARYRTSGYSQVRLTSHKEIFAPKVPQWCHEVTHNIAKNTHQKKRKTRIHSSVHQYCISVSFVFKVFRMRKHKEMSKEKETSFYVDIRL